MKIDFEVKKRYAFMVVVAIFILGGIVLVLAKDSKDTRFSELDMADGHSVMTSVFATYTDWVSNEKVATTHASDIAASDEEPNLEVEDPSSVSASEEINSGIANEESNWYPKLYLTGTCETETAKSTGQNVVTSCSCEESDLMVLMQKYDYSDGVYNHLGSGISTCYSQDGVGYARSNAHVNSEIWTRCEFACLATG